MGSGARLIRGAFAALLTVTAGVVSLPESAEAGVLGQLAVTSLRGVVVDDARQRIYVIQDDHVLVTDLAGQPVGRVLDGPQVARLSLSHDGGTLWAAVPGTHDIVGLSTSTLAETSRFDLGPTACPNGVVPLSGTKLAIAREHCTLPLGAIGVLDTATGAVVEVDQGSGAPTRDQLLASSPGSGDIFVAGARSSGSFVVLSAAGPTPTVLAQSSGVGQNVLDLDISSDGTRLLVTWTSATSHSVFGLPGLTGPVSLPGSTSPMGGAWAPTGSLVFAGYSESDPISDVYIHDAATGALLKQVGVPGSLVHLSAGSDGTSAYAVSRENPAKPFVISRITLAPDPLMTLTGRQRIALGDPAGLRGSLRFDDAPVAGLPLTLHRRTGAGPFTEVAAGSTATDGTFAFADAPVMGGTTTYQVRFAGDGTRGPTSSTWSVEVLDPAAVFPLPPPDAARSRTFYTPLVPARLLDTRPGMPTVDGLGLPGTPLGPGGTLDLQVTGRGGVPSAGVSAVALNVTAVTPSAPTFVTIWPAGEPRPEASNLNAVVGEVAPNLVIAKVSADGRISLFNRAGDVDLIVDIAGYFPAADGFVPVLPARVLETRAGLPTIDGLGAPGAAVGPRSSIDVVVAGRGGVPPTGVDAVVLNVTATGASAPSFVTVWPTGSGRPTASNLNVAPGQTVPNLVVAKVGAGGAVSLYNEAGSVHLVADVAGYFPTGGTFVGIQPARIGDTRPGATVVDGGTSFLRALGAGDTIELPVVGVGGVPDVDVSAVVLNVTAIAPSASSFVTIWPTGLSMPEASNLNTVAGQGARPNLVVARVGAGGTVSIFNRAGQVDLAIDVAGYFVGEQARPRQITTSDSSTCVLSDIGTLRCWGYRQHEPGFVYGPPEPAPMPYALDLFDDVIDVDDDYAHTCVLRRDQQVWCWTNGSDGSGVTGSGGTGWPPAPAVGLSDVVDVDTGVLQSCALVADGTVWCWGLDETGAVRRLPQRVGGLERITSISVGRHACAIQLGGRVFCWGEGDFGAIGDGSTVDAPVARAVSGLTDAVSVEVSSLRSCAIRENASAMCWGSGIFSTSTFATSVPIMMLGSDRVSLVGGDSYSCSLWADRTVSCDGIGPAAGIILPTTLPPVRDLVGDRFHACALTTDDDIYCWGRNTEGQIGDGSFTDRTTPVLVLDWP